MTSHQHKTPPEVPGYDIVRLIGLGGMGEVYLARQLALNRPVAIKLLSGPATDFPDEYILRFRREAELMARISHPNVVTIFDFGTAGGRPFLVMEYVEAGDLRSRMVPDVPMTPEEVGSIVRPVIRAVEYLHRQGIIHRDMKPENILIHREETPKVTDFGLAVLDFAIGSLTRTGRMMGTPGYVSPEQQYGLKVDERADQFSMAAMCYEMVTGRRPLGRYPPPSLLNPRLGREADAAIRKGLSEDPEDRFPTILQFGEALERGLSAAPGRRRPRRRAALAAGLAILASLVAAGLIASVAPRLPGGPGSAEAPRHRLVAESIGMDLVLVPRGEFWMGSPPTDKDVRDEEKPRHRVRITRPFYMGEKEVTVRQFRAFVNATNYRTTSQQSKRGGGIFNMANGKIEQKPDLDWQHPGLGLIQGDDEPVIQVSWADAVAFCEWLSTAEKRPYRLPTEAEWEYACRAGTETLWSSGDDPGSLDSIAWTLRNAKQVFHKVGSKRPNQFGLYDMHGNVWEWCSDWFAKYPGVGVVDPTGPPLGEKRVIRGGSIDWDDVERTRSASRLSYSPELAYFNYGFRVCSPAKP